ncbi:molybdopterin-guanine dinucleotide biosynthesis protein B [Xenophilus arseniciresistens]|uniref:Molybdopterin-guanine dinucleotide biosynthesis protein B n=1 Tax=Xenophilus arseniciresistens TaxID=1283306 RepID=A0AAE3N507_9BURK|nr:molybdopterin-guanine dinucleotide biosynthesis protein B [Xenophilus arseniciresistens]MDA7415660.1 molybdopterin-guanine dinucleotide biosynthesis protein B [Xenophilus arseniciresistens]
MKVLAFAGYSGAGKTTLVEKLIPLLRAQGLRVSVIKHAHHQFDVDTPGKDSWRHRQAGAFEVLVASDQRLALMREYEQQGEPDIHALIREMHPAVDWVLVEGFKHADLPKVEVLRLAPSADAKQARPVLYPDDPFVWALAVDAPDRLPEPTLRPVFDRDDVPGLAQWLIAQSERFVYEESRHG